MSRFFIHIAIEAKNVAYSKINLGIINKAAYSYFRPLHIAENTHWHLQRLSDFTNSYSPLSMLLRTTVGEVKSKNINPSLNEFSQVAFVTASRSQCCKDFGSSRHKKIIPLLRVQGYCQACDLKNPIRCHTKPSP